MILASQKLAVEKPHRFPLILICLLSGVWTVNSACADTISNAPAQISSLEQALSGDCRPELPLKARIENLESSVFGHPGSGALKDRIIQLKKYLGVEEKEQIQKTASSKSKSGKNLLAAKPDNQSTTKTKENVKASAQALTNESSKAKNAVTGLSKNTTSLQAAKKSGNTGLNILASKQTEYKPLALPKIEELPSAQKNGIKNQIPESKNIAAEPSFHSEPDLPRNTTSPRSYDTDPDLPSLMNKAMGLYHDGKTELAEQSFKDVLKHYPDCVDASYNLGSIAEHKGDKKAAIDHYSKALYLAPDDGQIKEALSQLTGKNYDRASTGASSPDQDADGRNDPSNSDLKANAVDNVASPNRNFATNDQNNSQAWTPPPNHSSRRMQAKAFQTAASVGGSVLRYSLRRAISSMR